MDASRRRARVRERWLGRAERARDAFGLVLVLVLVNYALLSLLADRGWTAVILTISTSATSVVALISSHTRLQLIRPVLVLAVIATALAVASAISGDRTWLNIGAFVEIALLTVAMFAVLRRVVGSADIGTRTILGAISFYTVLGILFTYLYGAIDHLQSGPFFEGVKEANGSDYLFFSYTTLTTTGFGDLVPGGQPGRMIAGLEMMLGQIFLVTLVAGLVSLWRPGDALRRNRQRRGGDDTPAPPLS